jgi:hypothetical protein
MKKFIASAVALVISAGIAASASAAPSLSPANGTFTGDGSTSLKKGTLTLPCTAHFTGHTTAGVGTIDTATFSGSGGLCGLVTKTGTWTATATGAGTANIAGVSVNASLFGTCGPSNVPVTISGAGVINFASVVLAPDCAINGSVATSPAVTAIP